jgi:O-antigen ligase
MQKKFSRGEYLMQLLNDNQNYKLVMLFPLVFLLMPRFDGSHYITFPLLAILLIVMGYMFLKPEGFSKDLLDRNILIIGAIISIYVFFMGISILYNFKQLSFNAIPHLFKPILFLIVLGFGYVIALKIDYSNIIKGLLKGAYIILFAQIIVGLTQLLDLPIFSFLYDDSKSYPIWKLVRTTGTLTNPNVFGWFITQMIVIIYLFENNKRKKWAWVFIGLILMVLSGSRSVLLVFPLVFVLIELFRTKIDKRFFTFKLPIFITGLIISLFLAYQAILKFGHFFPYLRQLLLIIRSGSLSSVSSFSLRTEMWENALTKISEKDSLWTWIFGLGPGSISILDKDLLYSLVNYGLIGTILMIVLYGTIAFCFIRLKDKTFSILGIQYIIFSFIIGYQVETLSGWNYPMLIMFYTGIALVLLKKQKEV